MFRVFVKRLYKEEIAAARGPPGCGALIFFMRKVEIEGEEINDLLKP